MSDNHRETYRALVRALRAEFADRQLEALDGVVSVRFEGRAGALGTLVRAVHDAADPAYDEEWLKDQADTLTKVRADTLVKVRAGTCPDCGHELDPEEDGRRGCLYCGSWFEVRSDLP